MCQFVAKRQDIYHYRVVPDRSFLFLIFYTQLPLSSHHSPVHMSMFAIHYITPRSISSHFFLIFTFSFTFYSFTLFILFIYLLIYISSTIIFLIFTTTLSRVRLVHRTGQCLLTHSRSITLKLC
jgi:hypothetical protein